MLTVPGTDLAGAAMLGDYIVMESNAILMYISRSAFTPRCPALTCAASALPSDALHGTHTAFCATRKTQS
eukprot:3817534-Rhodomonas_salina.3